MNQEPMEWESEFEEEFGSSDGRDFFDEAQRISKVKNFIYDKIKQAEERERKRIVEEIREIVDVDKDSRAKIIYYINQNNE
jgi:hypothetical protein